MGKLEDTLAQGVKEGKIPHAVIFATNADGVFSLLPLRIDSILMIVLGSFTYNHAVGSDNLGDENPIAEDAVFQLASQTKLLTSIAALQVIEKGLFGLDQDVATILPELAEQPILTGFDDDDKPSFQKRKNTITFK